MKGFSPFTKKEDGWRPVATADMGVAAIERKQERINEKAAKGKDVSGKQKRLDRQSEKLVASETKRAERKERKADKKERKGKGKQAARKQYKADKIRESVSPLAKKSPYKQDKKVPRVPTKPPLYDVVDKLRAKKRAGTITAAELKKLNQLVSHIDKDHATYNQLNPASADK